MSLSLQHVNHIICIVLQVSYTILNNNKGMLSFEEAAVPPVDATVLIPCLSVCPSGVSYPDLLNTFAF